MKARYLIQYEDIKHIENDIPELIKLINDTPGFPVKDLKIMDLVFNDGKPIYRGVGVYIFKTSQKVYYVGSCVSRNFVERIPAHFDVRHGGWFNTLLKFIMKQDHKLRSDQNLTEAALHAFENLKLVLINFDRADDTQIKHRIKNLESRLGRDCLKPYNTRFPRYKELE